MNPYLYVNQPEAMVTSNKLMLNHESPCQQNYHTGVSSPNSDFSLDPVNMNLEAQLCNICGDRATGKHYGAYSCDGCKGFFRRSVRKNHQYQCRFSRQCAVGKDNRNQCRFCRLDKCFRSGMRKEAVQNERDKISYRRSPYDETLSSCAELSLPRLLNAEKRIQDRQMQGPGNAKMYINNQNYEASVSTVCDSMQHQLLLMVEWAKSFSVFSDLKIEEQVALLKAHAGDMLILGVAYRSRAETTSLILGNCYIISLNNPDPQMAFLAGRVLREIVFVFRELDLDMTELACLKAIVFFDPDAMNLPTRSSRQVRQWRSDILAKLHEYMNTQQYKKRGRFGELLLILPKLQSINSEMIRQIRQTKIGGLAYIDALLQELLLGEPAEIVTPPMDTQQQTFVSTQQQPINSSFNHEANSGCLGENHFTSADQSENGDFMFTFSGTPSTSNDQYHQSLPNTPQLSYTNQSQDTTPDKDTYEHIRKSINVSQRQVFVGENTPSSNANETLLSSYRNAMPGIKSEQ